MTTEKKKFLIEDLKNVEDLNLDKLPPKYTREKEKRIFVNRAINLEKIEYFGFDMVLIITLKILNFNSKKKRIIL